MKQYFIAFDYWDNTRKTGINKFASGVRELDIHKTPIIEVCRQMIVDLDVTTDASLVNIKVTAFNNIE